jgi:hypothetical protein
LERAIVEIVRRFNISDHCFRTVVRSFGGIPAFFPISSLWQLAGSKAESPESKRIWPSLAVQPGFMVESFSISKSIIFDLLSQGTLPPLRWIRSITKSGAFVRPALQSISSIVDDGAIPFDSYHQLYLPRVRRLVGDHDLTGLSVIRLVPDPELAG